MRLTKVEVYGFKSFARRTEFEFGPGVSAIVGPNGCGKSNLVDAVRWALGEQRPKQLRSASMSDVVYRGASANVAHAEVELTFDNSDGVLPHSAPEITVTRRLEADGEGEYRLNDQVVRLKDVRELFLDTGLGVGGYAFMEQGRIDAILQAGAQERRALVEEAAGTSRYRLRRKEAVRKLDRTEQDLSRAGDILAELERQVRSLKVQAGKARNWREKKGRLERLQTVLFVRRSSQLETERGEVAERAGESAEREKALVRRLRQAEESLRAREEDDSRMAAELAERRETQAEQRSRAEHLTTRHKDLLARSERTAEDLDQGGERCGELGGQVEALATKVTDAEERLAGIKQEIEAGVNQGKAAQEVRESATRAQSECEKSIEDLQAQQLDLVERLQELRNETSDLDSELRATRGTRRKLVLRSNELVRLLEEAGGLRREHRRKLVAVRKELGELEAELSADDEQLREWFTRMREFGTRSEESATQLAADQSRLQVLEDAISRHEGVDEQVREILQRAAEGEKDLQVVEGIIADLITASSESAAAVEAALGPRAEALVVADREAANQVLRWVRKHQLDRVRVLSRSELPATTAADGRLLFGATYHDKDRALLRALLGSFDLLPGDVPLDLCTPRPGRSLVSSDGDLMTSRYETVSRGKDRSAGLITRRTECERLHKAVTAGERYLERLREESAQIERFIQVREQERELRVKRRNEVQSREQEQAHELRAGTQRTRLLREELSLDHRELVEMDRRGEQIAGRRAQLEGRRKEAEEERTRVHDERHRQREILGELATSLREAEARVGELELEAARLKERHQAAEHGLEEVRARHRERGEELHHLQLRLAQLGEQRTALEESTHSTEAETQQVLEQIAATETELQRLSGEMESRREQTVVLRSEVTEIRADLEEERKELQGHEIRQRELKLHHEMLTERIREELDSDVEELSRRLEELQLAAESGDDDADALELRNLGERDLEDLQRDADELKRALQRLGPVNLEAVEELDGVEGRVQFLSAQRDDLVDSRRTLRKMIDEIDQECDQRFAATFEQVREHFRVLFRRLFGGGRADLILLEADDPTDSGVDVVAAPPGKDPRSLQMLSGGERTLTAVALLFSLFSTRPSPFSCVLDEVDAALDESNIGRFTGMLKSFMGQTQFIIVTHSKRTMAAADTLYGVTMEGNGISRPIAMRFEGERARGAVA